VERCYPQIETFVFLGKNLFDDDLNDTWYFQFIDQCETRETLAHFDDDERRVMSIEKRDLEKMLTLDTLKNELDLISDRRAKKN